jgi:DNA invertase Pin-like site-specific DNA recombinase
MGPTVAAKPKVYSYLRFSDPKQAAGSSADRQLQYARRWAAERGIELDASLTMLDEGLSAYHQRHVTRGALGAFLAAIDDGAIAPGSVLIVEGLDRLSRAEPIQAQAQLAQIINAGITVVTASDGREYNREGLKAQPMDLVYSLLVMIRAHEESDTKSKRVRAAIHRQCLGWMAGTYRGKVRSGRDPHWLQEAVDGGWELAPERAEAVRLAIRMFSGGHGGIKTVRRLSEMGMQYTRNGNASQHLYKLFRNRALVGEKVLTVDGTEYRLAGYYPALLSVTEFDALQQLAAQRRGQRGVGTIPALITGLRIACCGYCGGALVSQNLMTRKRREDGGPQFGHRRLICANTSNGPGCPGGGSCSTVPIEHALMHYCADRMNLAALLSGGDNGQIFAAQLAAARVEASTLQAKLDRITEALETGDSGQAPAAFLRRAHVLESELASVNARSHDLEAALAAVATVSTPALSDAWAALAEGVTALETDARLRARQLVADTFSRIVIYNRGVTPGPKRKWGGIIHMLLVTKRGGSRLLEIDRRTGHLRTAEDVAAALPLPPAALT